MPLASARNPDGVDERPLAIEIGGSDRYWGGVQMFSERASEALVRYEGWRIRRINAETPYMSLRKLPFLLRGLGQLVAARRDRPQCVWIQYGNMADLAYVVFARAIGLRVMVTPHLGKQWKSQSRPFLRATGNFALKAAHRLALISPTQDEELQSPTEIPRSLIRLFLPPALLDGPEPTPNATGTPLRLLHGGRLSAEKGTFLFVDMCARLRDQGVDFEAKITGVADATALAELERRIADAHLDDHVEYLGMLPGDGMIDMLRQSDVLVHLSRQDSYPAMVIEAMACGTFPICFDLPGARHMISSYDGHVVGSGDIAEEVSRWLAAQPLGALRARALGVSTRVRQDFAWSRSAAMLSKALKAVSARADRRALAR